VYRRRGREEWGREGEWMETTGVSSCCPAATRGNTKNKEMLPFKSKRKKKVGMYVCKIYLGKEKKCKKTQALEMS
jgi:hypothetical protein